MRVKLLTACGCSRFEVLSGDMSRFDTLNVSLCDSDPLAKVSDGTPVYYRPHRQFRCKGKIDKGHYVFEEVL